MRTGGVAEDVADGENDPGLGHRLVDAAALVLGVGHRLLEQDAVSARAGGGLTREGAPARPGGPTPCSRRRRPDPRASNPAREVRGAPLRTKQRTSPPGIGEAVREAEGAHLRGDDNALGESLPLGQLLPRLELHLWRYSVPAGILISMAGKGRGLGAVGARSCRERRRTVRRRGPGENRGARQPRPPASDQDVPLHTVHRSAPTLRRENRWQGRWAQPVTSMHSPRAPHLSPRSRADDDHRSGWFRGSGALRRWCRIFFFHRGEWGSSLVSFLALCPAGTPALAVRPQRRAVA